MRDTRATRKSAYAAALLIISGLASFSAPPASAQVGSSLVVTITSPTSGSTVGGTIPVNASVSTLGGAIVRGVQFKLDGANLGAEDTSDPYSVSWDTRTASNGSHTLVAVGRDTLGLTWNSDPVTVTVFNDTIPPTVAITSPASGAAVAGTIAVNANASDNVGVVGVQFKLDGVNLGAEGTSSPYSVSWSTTTATAGAHTLTAIARDAAGNTTTSSAVTVTVDNVAPTAAITAPSSGALLAGSTTVAATASDNVAVAGVRFFVDGAPIGVEDTTAPYSVAWNTTTVASGAHTLTAVARDTAGNTTTSGGVAVTVDNTPPTVAITAPSSGATVSGTTTVAANASDNVGVAGVRFFVDGAPIGVEVTTAPYSVAWNTTTVAGGAHTLTAVARDTAGNTTTSGGVAVTVDNTPPTVAITAPSNGATVAGTTTVTASASDNVGVAGVRFFVDGAPLGAEVTTAPYSVTWDTTTAANGSHTLTAVARDAAGNTTTSAGVAVTVNNIALAVTVTAPSPGVTVAGTTTVTASASSNAVGVQFFVDAVAIGAESTSAPYSVTWDTTTVASGSHTLTAVARDAAGNRKTSAGVIVTVSQTATRFENTELAITYTDGTPDTGRPANWWYASRSRGWSGVIASFNRSQGARATFHFTGTTVRWIGFRAPWAGIGRVYLDDVFVQELDLYQPTEAAQAVVFATTGLTLGSHTLTVESTGRKNASSSDYAVVVDAFDVAPASPPPTTGTRIDETALSFTAGWVPAEAATRAWSGGTAEVTSTPGAQATVSFIGTEVRWVGLRGPQTGIARVYLDGSYQADVDTYAANEVETVVYATTGLVPGRHTLVIEATGNKNAAATDSLIVVDAVDARSRIEDADPSVTYSSGWLTQGINADWSGSTPNTGNGSAEFTRTAGAKATLSFSGTSVTWIGLRGTWTGIARVSVDGGPPVDVDTYGATDQVQVPLFSATGLTDGPHTLTVEVTGNKNASAIDSMVVVDAFDIGLSPNVPPVTRFQETDPAATYTAGWTPGGVLSFWSGSTATYSGTAGARATFTFTGSNVRWIGQLSFNGGFARVLLDGVQVAQIDTFAPIQEQFQAAMYTATGLANTTHTLAIEATGQKNASSSNTWVFVDAFDVY